MADRHAPTTAPPMESARTEQIIAQFIQKSLHLILDARVPALAPKPRPPAAARRKDKWFQLDLWDVLDASASCPWHHPILDPMLVDVFLLPDPDPDPRTPAKETVLERWVVQYEPLPGPTASGAAAADSGVLLFRKMYKKMLILMRSLYSALRFLPAHRVHRMHRRGDFRLGYRVSTFGEPFTRAEEEGMRVQGFAPVEAAHGRVSVSVTYRADLSDLSLEPSGSYPPQIIADYVGSPAAEPIKIFHSSGACYSSSTRGYRSTPSAASSSSPFSRPHSWTSGIHQPVPASSAPTHYSPPDIGGARPAGHRSIPRKKAMSFDDHGFSPPFSPSPSPASSPLYARLRSESTSTPVNIPLPMMGKGGGGGRHLSPNLSDPNKQFLPPPSPRSFKGENSSGSPSGSRSFRRLDGLRGAENYSGSSNLQGYGGQKVVFVC